MGYKSCNNIPEWVVWMWHLSIAGVLMAMGSIMVQNEQEDKDVPLHIGWAVFLIVIAGLAVFYHGGAAIADMYRRAGGK
jgi:uncharacterized membrane protein YhaH (DUF805 family)